MLGAQALARRLDRSCGSNDGTVYTSMWRTRCGVNDAESAERGRAINVKRRIPVRLWCMFVTMILWGAVSAKYASAQEPNPVPSPAVTPKALDTKPLDAKPPGETHRFWDKENDWLFAGVGASRTLDYFSTLNFRRRGRQEIFLTNDLVDNHAAFAAVEAGATGLSIGMSYMFHHYGHHKLERWTSITHIGLTTTGAVRNYCLKTAHPASPSTMFLEPSNP